MPPGRMPDTQNPEKPVAVDLFSGVGGLSLGFERSGFDIKIAIDNDPINVETYAQNFPTGRSIRADLGEVSGGDIQTWLNDGEIASPDVMFGGPPCQGFSYGGQHLDNDPRNEMVDHFARLVGEIRPKYFVMENVAGLLSKRNVAHLQGLVNSVRSQGYEVTEPVQVLNAADFGVPQQRKRVFILGQIAGLPPAKYPSAVSQTVTVWDAIGDLPDIETYGYLANSDIFTGDLADDPSEYAKLLRDMSEADYLNGRADLTTTGLSGCATTRHSEKSRNRFASTPKGTFEPTSRFFRLSQDGLARTIRAGSDSSHGSFTAPRPLHPIQARCISVREGARLHGFPDWFQFHPTKWHGFRQIGNAVPPPLASAVGDAVYEALAEAKAT